MCPAPHRGQSRVEEQDRIGTGAGEMEAEHRVIPGVTISPWKTRALVSLMVAGAKTEEAQS